jgi:hypothetical protein
MTSAKSRYPRKNTLEIEDRQNFGFLESSWDERWSKQVPNANYTCQISYTDTYILAIFIFIFIFIFMFMFMLISIFIFKPTGYTHTHTHAPGHRCREAVFFQVELTHHDHKRPKH